MKKFNATDELNKIKNKKQSNNSSRLSNIFVPVLIVACSCLAFLGVTFSTKLANDSLNYFTIKVFF